MHLRHPHVAGRFYPGTARQCTDQLNSCLARAGADRVAEAAPCRVLAGVVPHAGWDYSGPTAARVFGAIRRAGGAHTFILFGAVHDGRYLEWPSVWARGQWRTPLGDIPIDEDAARLLVRELPGELEEYPEAHLEEHSLEVQMPFIQHLFPGANVVPVMVPPSASAGALGRRVAQVLMERGPQRTYVALGSTDLTHYGPIYGFEPRGPASQALEWSKQTNDRRILELALQMREDEIVAEADAHHNACGAGALAAVCGYAHHLGVPAGELLEHTTSIEVVPERNPSHFVGYAGITYGEKR